MLSLGRACWGWRFFMVSLDPTCWGEGSPWWAWTPRVVVKVLHGELGPGALGVKVLLAELGPRVLGMNVRSAELWPCKLGVKVSSAELWAPRVGDEVCHDNFHYRCILYYCDETIIFWFRHWNECGSSTARIGLLNRFQIWIGFTGVCWWNFPGRGPVRKLLFKIICMMQTEKSILIVLIISNVVKKSSIAGLYQPT